MKPSTMPTDTLKLFRVPGVRLATMKSSMSGCETLSTPIWAPRRAPADSTVWQTWSNTFMKLTGPEARELVFLTQPPLGRMALKL